MLLAVFRDTEQLPLEPVEITREAEGTRTAMAPLETHGDDNTDIAAIVRLCVSPFQLILLAEDEGGALSILVCFQLNRVGFPYPAYHLGQNPGKPNS